MYQLVVKVFADGVTTESRAKLFERMVPVPSGIAVDFEGLRKALHFLYGTRVVVVFEFHP